MLISTAFNRCLFLFFASGTLLLLGFMSNFVSAKQSPSIPMVYQFNQLAKQSVKNRSLILLYVSAPQCPYCKKLEQDILYPLLRSGEYKKRLVLTKLNWLSTKNLIDFNGELISTRQFLQSYHIKVTPTLLFLDQNGRQVHEAFIGYQANQFYWYYFDAALDKSNRIIHSQYTKP